MRGVGGIVMEYAPSKCVQGRAQCAIADCFIVQCVDSYNDPTKCCPVCPNGKTNILLKTLILQVLVYGV
jgi:hypothetical protein